MNLEQIVQPIISTIVPRITISLYLFDKNIIDEYGKNTTNYIIINYITAQVQLANIQKLFHKNYFNVNSIYKRFYIQSNSIVGLNRNLETAGDYIKVGSLYYKIVEINEAFNTGWINVVGAETDSITIG